MNRRDLLKGFVSTTSYFFLGGIYRPPTSAVVVDRVNKVILVRGLDRTISASQFLDRLRYIFKGEAMPMVPAFPGWRYTTVDGWRLKRSRMHR